MKKKFKPNRLPGQMPPKEGESIQEQKRRERVSTMYNVFRTIFEQQCIQLGIQEFALMEYREEGALATVKPRIFPEQQKEDRHQYMEKRLIDFHMMTKTGEGSLVTEAIAALEEQIAMLKEVVRKADEPPKPEPAPILGADGLPVQSTKDAGVLPSPATDARSDEGDTERAA